MYKPKLTSGYFILFAVILFGCHANKAKEDTNDECCTIRIKNYKETLLHQSDFINYTDTIALYTYDHFIGDIKDLCISDSTLYILDWDQFLWTFCYPSGQLIQRINLTGHGHGEYISPSAITAKNGLLYLLDPGSKCILTYDAHLNYKEKTNLDFFAEDFICTESGFLFFSPSNTTESKCIISTDKQGKIQSSYLPPIVDIDVWFSEKVFIQDEQGNIFISLPYSNEIYRWTEHGPILTYRTDFGNNGYTFSSSITKGSEISDSKYAFNTNFFVVSGYLMNSFIQMPLRYYSFYDLKKDTSLQGQIDTTECIPFNPSWQHNDELIGICHTMDLTKWKPQNDSLCSAVLFVYHLKK